MSNLTVENVYTRQKAKELTQKYLGKLLGLMVTAVGIPYVISMVGIPCVISMVASSLQMLTKSEPVLAIGGFVLSLANMLLSSGLVLGLYSAMIDLCRGDDTVTVGRVFSRMGECLKAFGLNLWVGLKIMLWALPAYALMIALVFFALDAVKDSAVMAGEASVWLQTLLMISPLVVMVLVCALVVPAALRYMLSVYILADKPETGVFDCVNQSKAMMQGHKWQAFKLTLPIVLIMLVVLLVITVAVGSLGALLGLNPNSFGFSIIMMIVTFVAMLYYMIRMYLCYALFYLKRTATQEPAQAE